MLIGAYCIIIAVTSATVKRFFMNHPSLKGALSYGNTSNLATLAAKTFQLIEQPLSAFHRGHVPRGQCADVVLAGTRRLFPYTQ